MKRVIACLFAMCGFLTGAAWAGILAELGTVEIVAANFGTVQQGQSKTVTFEAKFGLHIRDLTFQVTSLPAPITVSPMSGRIEGSRFTWSATLPASALPGDYTSVQSSSGPFLNPIVIQVSKGGDSDTYNFPVTGKVVGFPYSMTPGQVDFGMIASQATTRTFDLKRIAFGSAAKDDFQLSVTDPFTITPVSGSLTGSQATTITVSVKPGVAVKNGNGTITVKDVKSGTQKTLAIKGQVAQISK